MLPASNQLARSSRTGVQQVLARTYSLQRCRRRGIAPSEWNARRALVRQAQVRLDDGQERRLGALQC
ncbi:MAG: hypothetical protein ACJ8H8_05035, partial [Geminicoccaceae bacterium]